jgi:uncharacterized membrane protein
MQCVDYCFHKLPHEIKHCRDNQLLPLFQCRRFDFSTVVLPQVDNGAGTDGLRHETQQQIRNENIRGPQMKLFELLYKREFFAPMLALTFASGACTALVLARVIFVGNIGFAFLVWNLFLAWLPLVFALLFRERCANGGRRGWKLFGLGVAWLLFFPNAPYIFTDLIHLTTKFCGHFWVDMILILLCALTGLMLGFVSLYLMQSLVAGKFGRLKSWLFVAGVAGLSGVGVFIGRFLRLNSWDIFLRPGKSYEHAGIWTSAPFANPLPFVFPILFAIFLFIAYMMFYALTRLPQLNNK